MTLAVLALACVAGLLALAVQVLEPLLDRLPRGGAEVPPGSEGSVQQPQRAAVPAGEGRRRVAGLTLP